MIDDAEGSAEYIRTLEDELELVTEQLIESEQKLSDTEGKLSEAERARDEAESKLLAGCDDSVSLALRSSVMGSVEEEKKQKDPERETQQIKEDLELLNEELTLTQEELRAAQEEERASSEALEEATARHSKKMTEVEGEITRLVADNRSAKLEVEALEKALRDSNDEASSLREEIDNMEEALINAKKDHSAVMEEIEALQNAFDTATNEAEQDGRDKLSEELRKEILDTHSREVDELREELESLNKANESLQAMVSEATANQAQNGHAVAALGAAASAGEVASLKSQLEQTKKSLKKQKEEAAQVQSDLQAQISKAEEELKLAEKELETIHKELADAKARMTSRESTPVKKIPRARSDAPLTLDELEGDAEGLMSMAKDQEKKIESLKEQLRMAEVKTKKLEEEVKTLSIELGGNPDGSIVISKGFAPASVGGAESGGDIEDDEESVNIETVLESGDSEKIAQELRHLAKKSSMQQAHNADLLTKILRLQGNIQVCCRIRPMKISEIQDGQRMVSEALSETEIGCFDSRTKAWKSYQFDKVWGPETTQKAVYKDVEPMALSVVDGYNACIFAYGQTGSGKTYTMEGNRENKQYGISSRTIHKIFHLLSYREGLHTKAAMAEAAAGEDPADEVGGRFSFSIEVGMLEIYNDDVFDLLANSGKKDKVDIRRGSDGRVGVPNMTKQNVTCLQDVLDLLEKGNKNRSVAATNLNEHSSRSHMVLNVQVTSTVEGEPPNKGNLFLVDLAGSERVLKSEVVGKELDEAKHINKSLAALGNVMEALDRKASHVPYRDSKLTHLLQDSLGGNSRTMMVVTVCPTSNAYDETQCALKFATRVRRINLGTAQRNVTSKNLEETVKNLSAEIKLLSKAKERSETQMHSLKRENDRVQERLRQSSESRSKSIDEKRTMEVLRKSNAEMTTRWQKEKVKREEQVQELENVQNELKKVQQKLRKVQREGDEFERKMKEKENEINKLNAEVRKAKDASSAATIRARKAQVMQSRMPAPRPSSTITPKSNHGSKLVKPTSSRTPASGSARSGVRDAANAEEIRGKVLELLEKHDPKKVNKIDAIMERFEGREEVLMEKMVARYEGEGAAGSADDSASVSSHNAPEPTSGKTRSEIALAKHQQRMLKKKQAQENASGRKW
uniref:Kinesin motor domain-containing protein n=1 Tax=Helicotheca tamesis TaxID=374047 RepID=A0A7S2GTT1_9STRA